VQALRGAYTGALGGALVCGSTASWL